MKRLVIITGASRGIGAQIAFETSKKFSQNTTFLLIARNLSKLKEVRATIDSSSSNKILILEHDFSKAMKAFEFTEILKNIFQNEDLSDLNELWVFYNHGTFKCGKIEEVCDDTLNEFQINVSSVWTLISSLRSLFPDNLINKQFHINISSLLASQPLESCSAYNTTRSARATLFKCLALEHPNLRILNYQPGPVYTDMLKQVYDTSKSKEFISDYNQGKFLTPEQTVKRLWDILDKNQYVNGSSIDYYDEL